MNTLITYITRHGSTETASQILEKSLGENVTRLNLKKDKMPSLEDFDTIILGASIHAGQVQGKMKKFIEQNKTTLLKKKLGLFLCCMEEGEKAESQFQAAFPGELREHATASGLFGGEFNFDKMNFFEKWIVKKVAKVTEPVSNIKEKNIQEFASKIK